MGILKVEAGNLPVLVTTDLLSRGIDIEFLPFVINYELPRSPKDFVHRIGRTGRAENPGTAFTFVTEDAQHHFKVIQKKMKQQVEIVDANLNYNLLLGRSWTHAMHFVASSLFRVICFPHQGRIVIFD